MVTIPGRTSTTHRTGFWYALTAAPHRMFFLAGAAQGVIIMTWWALTLAGRYALLPAVAMQVDPVWAHAFLMIYGLFPFFIFGFLATVYPRWMDARVIARWSYVLASLSMACGMALFYAGLYADNKLIILATLLFLAGWLVMFGALLWVCLSTGRASMHELAFNLALAGGAGGIACFAVALSGAGAEWFTAARELGLWLFLVPIVFGVSHRMIPFFSSSVLAHYRVVRPAWSLPVVLTCTVGHVALVLLGLRRWLFVCDLPLTAAALYHTFAWGFLRSFGDRLLAMLHVAFLWLPLAMALYSLQSLVLFGSGRLVFGRAPLHALGIGFITGMVVAMASRVSLGHSGRSLTANRLTWNTLLGISIAALLRIGAALTAPLFVHAYLFSLAASVAWLGAVIPWVWHYAPMYWRPRADGHPG